jgi:hypothetical protein
MKRQICIPCMLKARQHTCYCISDEQLLEEKKKRSQNLPDFAKKRCKTLYYWGKWERRCYELKKLTPPILRTRYNFPPERAQPFCWPTPEMVINPH